jgi:hypothetical protein
MSTASSHMRLEVISGNASGSMIVVADELVIGRHATGAGKLSEDEEISRQHARISREVTGDYAIEDLGSSNGTFVNGLRIQSSRLLSPGDSIETGATTLVVREIVQPDPAEAGSETAARAAPDLRRAPTVFARSPTRREAEAASDTAGTPASDTADAPAPDTAGGPVSEHRRAPTVFARSPVAQPASVEPARQTPRLALELEIDFDAREARIALREGGETLRMVFEDGSWRAAPAEPDADRQGGDSS